MCYPCKFGVHENVNLWNHNRGFIPRIVNYIKTEWKDQGGQENIFLKKKAYKMPQNRYWYISKATCGALILYHSWNSVILGKFWVPLKIVRYLTKIKLKQGNFSTFSLPRNFAYILSFETFDCSNT